MKQMKVLPMIFKHKQNPSSKELILEWLEMRKEMDNLEVDSLFITKYGGEYRQMSKGTIQDRVTKIGEMS